jgi:predicted amidohydrolase
MLTIAQIQLEPKLGDCEFNNAKINSFLDQSLKADLIVLPELANTGYNFIDRDHAFRVASDKNCIDYKAILVNYAKQNNVYIVSGYLEKEGDLLYNSSLFVTPEGNTGNYRKIHLFMDEKKIFEPGNLGLPVFDIRDYKMGMLICFDYLFPEIWRIMALKGVDFVVHPSNLITDNAYKVIPAQSLINGYCIITSNRIGTEGDITFCGKSFVTDKRGNVISSMNTYDEGVNFTEIHPLLSRNKMITSGNHVLNDRRPECYEELVR